MTFLYREDSTEILIDFSIQDYIYISLCLKSDNFSLS